MPVKQCKDCKEFLALDYFHKSKTEKFGVRSRCKVCRSKYQRENGEHQRQRAYNISKYGITFSDLESLYCIQNGLCAICSNSISLYSSKEEKTRTACIDHNHKTGEVRGLLCFVCNSGLGKFKDSIKNLEKAIEYLKERGSYSDS